MIISQLPPIPNACRECKPPRRHPGCHSDECPDWVTYLEIKKKETEKLNKAKSKDREVMLYMKSLKKGRKK